MPLPLPPEPPEDFGPYRTKRGAILVAIIVALAVTGGFYYGAGRHTTPFCKSYFLEKEIRDLLYTETHEPTDYFKAARRYDAILEQIHFDNSKENYSARYQKALERTVEKCKMIQLLDASAAHPQNIQQVEKILHSPEYRALEEYGFTSLYWGTEPIDDEWLAKHMTVGAP